MKINNLFNHSCAEGECFDVLLETDHLRLERIVSIQHATPEGEWYDQVWPEWVLLLKGSAGLKIEGQADIIRMKPGDTIYLPAHVRHRVEWTDAETLWLALHHSPASTLK